MKIAVSAASGGLDAQIDPRFGRCSYFVIVDSETIRFEAVENISRDAPSGAGIQAAQIVANTGAQIVLTGNVGPNAFQALSSLGIKVVTGSFGTVREAVEKFKSGQLKEQLSSPTSPMGFGTGGGLGMGRGMGRGGRRGGGGRGMGMKRWQTPQYGPQAPFNIPTTLSVPPQMPKEQEIQMLENQMKATQQQMEQIKKRLKELRR